MTGCGRWIRILCREAAGNNILSSKLLWRIQQCRGTDECRCKFAVLISDSQTLQSKGVMSVKQNPQQWYQQAVKRMLIGVTTLQLLN